MYRPSKSENLYSSIHIGYSFLSTCIINEKYYILPTNDQKIDKSFKLYIYLNGIKISNYKINLNSTFNQKYVWVPNTVESL